jgi:hypothetical protein
VPVGRLPFGRLDDVLPNPCGPRPRSVALPCADQFRDPALAGRLDDALLFTDARPFNPPPALADGGRLLASSRCRADIAPLFTSLPGRLFADAEAPALLRAPKPPVFAGRFAAPLTAPFPTRPADRVRESMVLTGMCEAAALGAVRATTERLATDEGGVATCPRPFAAPLKLALVGLTAALLVTRAPRKEASLRCVAPRLIAWPFTKAFREAAVTARPSCAYL